jgi:calcineurin-like phosphoesterase family protein
MKKRKFVTSDLHFHHENILKYEPRRMELFQTIDRMNQKLIKRWNGVVAPQDDVYIIGDFSWHGVDQVRNLLSQLNGNKFLIIGNHDEKNLRTHTRMLKAGFCSIASSLELDHGGIRFIMSHYPYRSPLLRRLYIWLRWGRFRERYEDKRLTPVPGVWLLHGHTHSGPPMINKSRKMYNVGTDYHNYTPVLLDEVVDQIKKLA